MQLVTILNGLGHSASADSVLDFDSSLAQFRALSDNIVPPGFTDTFTTLVFGNNNFGEETLSGKGTTHVTNGIIVQRDEKQQQFLVKILTEHHCQRCEASVFRYPSLQFQPSSHSSVKDIPLFFHNQVSVVQPKVSFRKQ